ncbi:MAG: hypothetical protein QOI99_1623 [Actinomycetota bacterium]|jgi:hypothetical protein|nr:hypothetical protein [Actinomycetota bacterium]
MGKASSSKKVARAARTGGGRTRRGATSWLWPSLMAVVVVLGSAGVVYSREQRQPDTSRPLAASGGKQGDHWHAAIGFDMCGTFAPDISEAADPLGIHTHADGVVHVHPFTSRSAGKNAKLGVFFDTVKAKVSSTQVQLPGQDAQKNGDKCDGKPATVQVKIWPSRDPNEKGTVFKGDPGDIRLENNQLITVAFVPDGTDIPRPPSEPKLDSLNDLGTTPVPDELASTTTTPGTAGDATSPASSTPPETAPPGSAPPETQATTAPPAP